MPNAAILSVACRDQKQRELIRRKLGLARLKLTGDRGSNATTVEGLETALNLYLGLVSTEGEVVPDSEVHMMECGE